MEDEPLHLWSAFDRTCFTVPQLSSQEGFVTPVRGYTTEDKGEDHDT